MRITVAFKDAQHSDRLADYAIDKVQQQVEKLTTEPIEIALVFSSKKSKKIFNCVVVSRQGSVFKASAEEDNYHNCVDRTVERLSAQIKKKKDKKQGKATVRRLQPQVELPHEDEDMIDAEELLENEARRKKAG